MAKKVAKATGAFGPRMLAMFHHGKGRLENRHFHALAWVERAQHNGTLMEPMALHLIYNDDGKVIHEKRAPEELQYLEAAGGTTTAADFEQYLRKKLMESGGNTGAYEHLGVERPSVEIVVTPDKKVEHDELYARAARLLQIPEADLRAKYGSLNPGLQAMNLRNRLRKAGHNV